jgi:hypothetical protein
MGFEDKTRNAAVSINTVHLLHDTVSLPSQTLTPFLTTRLKIKTISLCLKRRFSIYCGY